MSEKPPQLLPKESVKGDSHTTEYDGVLYDAYKLIHFSESLPEENIPINTLSYVSSNNYWKDSKGRWLGPHHILDVAEKYGDNINWEEIIMNNPDWATEIEKIRNADYVNHPLLVVGDDYVVDGIHRLTKALLDKVLEIKIKRFDTLPVEAIYEEENKT